MDLYVINLYLIIEWESYSTNTELGARHNLWKTIKIENNFIYKVLSRFMNGALFNTVHYMETAPLHPCSFPTTSTQDLGESL